MQLHRSNCSAKVTEATVRNQVIEALLHDDNLSKLLLSAETRELEVNVLTFRELFGIDDKGGRKKGLWLMQYLECLLLVRSRHLALHVIVHPFVVSHSIGMEVSSELLELRIALRKTALRIAFCKVSR
jgi:hypothetical protein